MSTQHLATAISTAIKTTTTTRERDLLIESLLSELKGSNQGSSKLTDFLELTYEELKEKNIVIKRDKEAGKPAEYFEQKLTNELREARDVKAIMVCFADLEGKLHMLDYDKEFLLNGYDNLTFDGSSITGFTSLGNSDLRLSVDWSSLKWLPSDVFGAGKVLVFSFVCDKDGTLYGSDYRSQLFLKAEKLKTEKGITVNVAPEIEGFLFDGIDAEQNFELNGGFKLATKGGYFNTLPQDTLRRFIDRVAEVQRALGFENEKDHPEVAPSQFEINFKYTDILSSADQILLYKLTARQVAKSMGYTACFLPKPISGINGNGMHMNMSFATTESNLFYGEGDKWMLSESAYKCLTGVLYYGRDICLTINSSVNSYRRLDPNFEAPNSIKVSSVDRGSMIRVPLGNAKSARVEVRSVAPDANPYLAFFTVLSAALKGFEATDETYTTMKQTLAERGEHILPGTIYEAIEAFAGSEFISEILGNENKQKFIELKEEVAHMSPQRLGVAVKSGEVLFHHEIRNQVLFEHF